MANEKRSRNEKTEIPPTAWSAKEKSVVAIVLAVVLIVSGLLWTTARTILTGEAAPSLEEIRWPTIIAAFTLYFCLIALAGVIAIIVRSRFLTRGAYVLVAALPFVWFGVSFPTVIAALLLFISLWQFDWNVRTETAHRTHFAVFKSLHYGLGFAVTLSLLAVSFLFYSTVERSRPQAATPVDAAIAGASNAVNQILALQVPSYDPAESIDALLRRTVMPQLENIITQGIAQAGNKGENEGTEPSLTNPAQLLAMLGTTGAQAVLQELPQNVRDELEKNPQDIEKILAETQQQTIDQALASFRDQLIGQLKVDADGSTPIGDVVKQLLDRTLRPRLTPYARFIPPVLALVMFVILQLFHAVYVPLISILAALFIGVLRAAKVLRVTTEQQPVDVVSIV